MSMSAKRAVEAKIWLSDLTVAVNIGYSAGIERDRRRSRASSATAFLRGVRMTTLQIEVEDATPVAARCDDDYLDVTLADGRVLRAPIWWYPRLVAATHEARSRLRLRRSASIGRDRRGHQRREHPCGAQISTAYYAAVPCAVRDVRRPSSSDRRQPGTCTRRLRALDHATTQRRCEPLASDDCGLHGLIDC